MAAVKHIPVPILPILSQRIAEKSLVSESQWNVERKHCVAKVRILLEEGADRNQRTSGTGFAVCCRYSPILKQFVFTLLGGRTALDIALSEASVQHP